MLLGVKTLPRVFQSSVVSYKFIYYSIIIPFAVQEPFVGRGLLRKIALEIVDFRVVKPREKTGPFFLRKLRLSTTEE